MLGAVVRDSSGDRWTNAVLLCARAAEAVGVDPAVPVVRALLRDGLRPPASRRTARDHGVRARARAGRAPAGPARGMNPLDRLAAAKLWLISDPRTPARRRGRTARGLPYLAHALYALTPVLTPEVARMTCDEYWRVYVNTDWLEAPRSTRSRPNSPTSPGTCSSTTPNAPAPCTSTPRPQLPWHSAADATWRTPSHPTASHLPGCRPPPELSLPDGRSAEEYFAVLSGLPAAPSDGPAHDSAGEAGCGSGADGVRREHELPPGADASELDTIEADEIRRRVAIEYRDHVTGCGTTPGDALRWAKDILEPTIAWEPLLAGAVRRAVGWTNGNTHYTYTSRSRRQGAVRDIVLPGTRRPLPNVAMVVDTSGSVDDQLLGRALGEVDGALAGLGVRDSAVTVLACDAAVHTVTQGPPRPRHHLAGGGGTDMRVGIRTAAALRPRPDLIVVFTDGYTPWPRPTPTRHHRHRRHPRPLPRRAPPTPTWAVRVECLLE